MTDKTAKQTALFFGFLTAAMTYASAQAAPAQPQGPAPTAVQRLMAECGVSERASDARDRAAPQSVTRAGAQKRDLT